MRKENILEIIIAWVVVMIIVLVVLRVAGYIV